MRILIADNFGMLDRPTFGLVLVLGPGSRFGPLAPRCCFGGSMLDSAGGHSISGLIRFVLPFLVAN